MTDKAIQIATECMRTALEVLPEEPGSPDFDGLSLCDVLDAIMEHVELSALTGQIEDMPSLSELEDDDEKLSEWVHSWIHVAMHWAFSLGVGTAIQKEYR